MKKVLILTAGFGDGHNAAARSLRDAVELRDEDASLDCQPTVILQKIGEFEFGNGQNVRF